MDLQSRVSCWREVFWRPFSKILLLVYGVVGAASFFKQEFMDPETQMRYQVVALIPSWSLQVWLVLGLAAIVIILLEGSYRAVRSRNDQIATLQRQRDEYTRPDLQPEIFRATSHFGSFGSDTLISLAMRVVNRGANSAVLAYRVHYRSETFDGFGQLTRLSAPIRFQMENGAWYTLTPEDGIDQRSGPITRGDYRVGKLYVRVPGDRVDEVPKGATITVWVKDYTMRETSVAFTGTGPATRMRYMLGESSVPGDSLVSTQADGQKTLRGSAVSGSHIGANYNASHEISERGVRLRLEITASSTTDEMEVNCLVETPSGQRHISHLGSSSGGSDSLSVETWLSSEVLTERGLYNVTWYARADDEPILARDIFQIR